MSALEWCKKPLPAGWSRRPGLTCCVYMTRLMTKYSMLSPVPDRQVALPQHTWLCGAWAVTVATCHALLTGL